jgi:hypothetical protein
MFLSVVFGAPTFLRKEPGKNVSKTLCICKSPIAS